MMIGGDQIQRVSIYELLHKELQCKTAPANGKIYPEQPQFPYQVRGILLDAEVSPYHQDNRFCDLELPLRGTLIGYFIVTGVIKDGEDLLAFRYSSNDRIPYDADQNCQKEIKENPRAFIESEREGRFADYVHLRSALKGRDKTITLEGAVRNSSPRLFLPKGMMVEAGTLRIKHGSIHADQNNPIYR
ncbi:MAG: hypothetical protein Q7K45_05305 [Nanoarchaeota archaeon]|nr:hypothetical protein [Nanoarchaeota archaeon]